MFIVYNLIVWLWNSYAKSVANQLQICIMPFGVIIATFGHMLNGIVLTQKRIRCYKITQQPGTILNLPRKYIYL